MRSIIFSFLPMLVVFAFLATPCTSIYGQTMNYEKVMAEADSMVKELTEKLELDEQQQGSIKDVIFNSLAKEQALESHLKMMEETLKEQAEKAKSETQTKIQALLNEKQRKLLSKELKKPKE